jgi:hypothetical protein
MKIAVAKVTEYSVTCVWRAALPALDDYNRCERVVSVLCVHDL